MNGVIIVNTLKKRLFVATTMIWGLSVTLPVLAEYKPIEQPVEPANPSLKIESRNDLFKENIQSNIKLGRIPQNRRILIRLTMKILA
ncbi:cytochrome c nitrite reductase subunit c552 [Pasteurella multocida subsp. multocida str. Anand1_buffalo]|nr:cytochrome c nitrite reductase subunit c552 [Pasteurella multocida subsp. multocida str. Anand1_buffalo]